VVKVAKAAANKMPVEEIEDLTGLTRAEIEELQRQ
jgi:hypothetical protein